MLDTAGRLHVDQALMDEMKAVAEASTPQEILLVVDALTGQDAVNVAKSFSDQVDADRRRPHPDGRRRARRRGAVDARGHRQADQVRRRRREDRRARALPSRAGRRPHPRHGRRRQPRRARAARRSRSRRPRRSPRRWPRASSTSTTFAASFSQMQRMGGLGALAAMLPGMKIGQISDGSGVLDDKMLAGSTRSSAR